MKRRWWKWSDDLTADRVWELATELGYGPALDELTEAVDRREVTAAR